MKDAYPFPTVEEALSQMHDGEVLCTQDLANAYQQLPATPETAAVLTVNTLKDVCRFRRPPFGWR